MPGPAGQPYLQMFGRLHDAAGEQLLPRFRRAATTDGLATLQEGLQVLGRTSAARSGWRCWSPSRCAPPATPCQTGTAPDVAITDGYVLALRAGAVVLVAPG